MDVGINKLTLRDPVSELKIHYFDSLFLDFPRIKYISYTLIFLRS